MNVKFCRIMSTPILSCLTHSHHTWEIIFQLSGVVTSMIGSKEYCLKPGDIVIIPPNTPHDGKSDDVYTDMYIQCENIDFSNVTILHDHDGCVLELMKMLNKTFMEKDNSYKRISDSILDTIFAYLHKYADTEYKYGFIAELKNEIYSNISNPDFNIADFSRKSGYNIDYLRRCFKSETGITPLEHLTKMRLNYAKGLLKEETFISIVDVSEKCGFRDSFYFSRLFKQHYGVSPLNYRKNKVLK